MELITTLLCDFAQVRGGLLYVASGGVTRFFAQALPTPLNLWLALAVEIQPDQVELTHEVRVTIVESQTARTKGQLTAGFQAGGDLQPGESLHVPLALPLGPVGIEAYGPHDVRVSVDNSPARILTVYVMEQPPQP